MTESFENLNQIHERSVSEYGPRPLFGVRSRSGWSWTTYSQFADMVSRCRGGLAALGIVAGDRVGIVSNNRIEWAVTCYGAASMGAALVPMYAAQSVSEWSFVLRDSGARCVIAGSAEIAAQLREQQATIENLEHVIGLDDPPDAAHSWARLLDGNAPEVPAAAVSPSDTLAILYTSGTTGTPKGVVLSHGNIASNVSAVRGMFPLLPSDRSLSFLPWAHAFGQTAELHTLFSKGCSIAINDEIPRLVENLSEVSPTVLVAVPRIFNRIYDGVHAQIADKPAPLRALFAAALKAHVRRGEGESLGIRERAALAIADRLIFSQVRKKFGGRLRFAISGSAALNSKIASFIDALGIGVYEGYGLTEASPVVTANTPEFQRIGTVGRVIPGVQVDVDVTVSDTSSEGELIVRGPNVMRGYYQQPEESAAVLGAGGELRTGDLGFIDDDGFVHITGRINEQFKLENGKYVAPGPLEERLKMIPLVNHAMLHGLNRPHSVALIAVDPERVAQWASREGHELGRDLSHDRTLRGFLDAHMKQIASDFRSFERPRGFLVISDEVSIESGLLTPTLKLKRHTMLQRYGAALDALYASA